MARGKSPSSHWPEMRSGCPYPLHPKRGTLVKKRMGEMQRSQLWAAWALEVLLEEVVNKGWAQRKENRFHTQPWRPPSSSVSAKLHVHEAGASEWSVIHILYIATEYQSVIWKGPCPLMQDRILERWKMFT
ncbi:hypothetical protein XELAEV_18047761mg, partial [Xenopus laevis]